MLGYNAATSRVKSCEFLRGFLDAFLLKLLMWEMKSGVSSKNSSSQYFLLNWVT